jgi:hypothetical protein
MAGKHEVASEERPEHWDVSDQSLLSATLMATPTQRIAWLEEALKLAYATGALKPRKFLTHAEWEAMGSSAKRFAG